MNRYLQESYEEALRENELLKAKLEQAEKAFERILVVDLDYSFEDVDQMKIIAEEALQAIRKGD